MTVTLPKEVEDFIRAKLSSGEFETADAVVLTALRNWQAEELLAQTDLGEIEARLLEAVDSPRSAWKREELDAIAERLRVKYGEG